MSPAYDPDYGNPYYADESWCDEDPLAYVPDEPEELLADTPPADFAICRRTAVEV